MDLAQLTYSDFDDLDEIGFFQILNQLDKLNCSYLSYTLEKPNEARIHFFSDKQWLNTFIEEGLIADCQLTQLCRSNRNLIIPWDKLHSNNHKQKMVSDARLDYGIANGITITHKLDGISEMIALATGKSNYRFVHNLMNNTNLLNLSLIRLRKLAMNKIMELKF